MTLGGRDRRWPVAVWLATAAALSATALAIAAVVGAALDELPISFVRRLPAWLNLCGLAGLTMMVVAAWALMSSRPIASIGLSAAVVGIAIPLLAAHSELPPAIQVAMVGLAPLSVAGAALVGWGWRSEARGRRWMLSVLALVALASAIHILAYDPFADPGCVLTCERGPAPAGLLLSTRAAVTLSTALVVLAALIAGAELLRTSGGRGLVAGGVLVALGALAAGWVIRLARWEDTPSAMFIALPVVVAAVAVGVTMFVVALRERRTRAEVRRVVDRLTATGSIAGPGSIREVQFAMPDSGRWVDELGRLAAEPSNARACVITEGDVPSVRLITGSNVDPESVLLALTPAARLALRNARLAALARARLDEVQASRRRIITVSDTERARIERDLHDGAQQRLVAATFHLNVALNRGIGDGGAATEADALVRQALENLRRLAHGIFPASLATNGLRAALEELGGASVVRVNLDVADVGLAPDAAFAAFAIVATGVDAAALDGSGQVAVHVAEVGNEVVIAVEVAGASVPADTFVDVTDRVAALGGSLNVAHEDGVTTVRARLPCGS